jgi:hypothetical protein
VKEKKRAPQDGKTIPDKVPTANVVQFMAQNVFKLGAILSKTSIWQQDGWPNPTERCRRSHPRQHQQL